MLGQAAGALPPAVSLAFALATRARHANIAGQALAESFESRKSGPRSWEVWQAVIEANNMLETRQM